MIVYLNGQLNIIQIRASEAESIESPSQGFVSGGNDSAKGKGVNPPPRVTVAKELCNLCNNVHPSPNKNFVYCKRFLLMSCKNRGNLVRKGKFCLQCLDGKTKFNEPNHECCDKWLCKNVAHARFDKKLHFLLCGPHVEDEANKLLFQEFKTEVFTADWQKKLFENNGYCVRHQAYLEKQPPTNNVTEGGHVEAPIQVEGIEEEVLADQGELVAHVGADGDDRIIESMVPDVNECEELEDASNFGPPVFLLQPIPFGDEVFNLMFDGGCQKFVCMKTAVDRLPDHCKSIVVPGPLNLLGVGDTVVTSQHGHYNIKLPIHDGRLANFNGLCLDSITGPMPPYPVRAASKELVNEYVAQGGIASDLPQVPVIVGGETHFLFGQQYSYLLPRLLFILHTGLAIYESMFRGVDGTRGCIGGPSKIFEMCEEEFLQTHTATNFRVYLQQQLSIFKTGYKVCLDYDSVSLTNSLQPHQVAIVDEDNMVGSSVVLWSAKKKISFDIEEAGTKIEYRCRGCRGCNDCKNGEYTEKISFKEENEQDVLTKCVTVDFQNKETVASLPFIANPSDKLTSNKYQSLKIYQQQTKQLAKRPDNKQAVIDMEAGLQKAGYVDWVVNLTPDEINLLANCASRYYMPWRVAYNENSVSTPVRVVFDASSITKSGLSLNDLLAKGIKSLNSLVEIFLRFRMHIVAIHTDIKKMYNRIKLRTEDWTYQRYWWNPTLDPVCEPTEKIIKTLIYGVKSSGNQAEYALRETARRQEVKFPVAAKSIIQDTYMDDCATGTDDLNGVQDLINDVDELLGNGGFSSKGYTISGRPVDPSLSKDGKSIYIFGTKYFPEADKLQMSLEEVRFVSKRRKKKSTADPTEIPATLTKRICAGVVPSLFDIIGLAAPVIAGMKLDIHDLVVDGYDWDDPISDEYNEIWIDNFKLMEEVGKIQYSRIVVPSDAGSLSAELICTGDASEKMTCAAIYIRFRRKNGQYSCQLMMSKTKIVPEHTTLPRAELIAATLNTHVSQIVKRALKDYDIRCIYVLDSEIALHWICSLTKQLLPFVRNRVIEVLRFTDSDQWHHVESGLNPADLGTRKGVKVSDIDSDSAWINGKRWMSQPLEELKGTVLRNIDDVKCDKDQLEEIQKEKVKYPGSDLCASYYVVEQVVGELGPRCFIVNKKKPKESVTSYMKNVKGRMKFSKYVMDPNRFNFCKVVRIFALFLKCVKIWYKKNTKTGRKSKVLSRYVKTIGVKNEKVLQPLVDAKPTSRFQNKDVEEFTALTEDEVQLSLDYFFQKASDEVKSFVHPKQYKNISVEKNGILYFTGRVPLNNVSFECTMTDVMIDLTTGTFIVPLVDRYSPVGFSITNQVHWYDPNVSHRGVESTIRATMFIAHIFGVRDIAKMLRKQCRRCRYLLKKTVDVEMGPLPNTRLCVAPPYYNTQVDLCGHFSAYSKHNKRTTLKIWLCVFVCCTTGMVSIKAMEGYDATQFLLAFSRFAADAGFPKKLLADSGSQLVNGCENMVLNLCDVKGKLSTEYGVEFTVCPVGGHNFHGKVERKIRIIKETIRKTAHDARLSVLEWETLSSEIANTINNLPVAIGNETEDLENLDLITPNRLKLGRNNDRSPVGVIEVSDKVDRILQLNSNIFNAWWEAWLTSAIQKLVPQPKWFHNDEHIKEGDIVLFQRNEGGMLSGEYKYGIVDEVRRSDDNRIRSVVVKYKNSTEGFDRTTFRAVRSLVIIHRIDEINIMEELGKATYFVQ